MDKEVVEKCLALCQALSNNNQSFSFSNTMGSDIFNFSSNKLVKSFCGKKKKSPSQLRREERRRQERKRAASEAEEDTEKVPAKSLQTVKCNHCDTKFNSEEELIAHNKSAHMNSTALCSPEKERGIPALGELQLSPILGQSCGEKIYAPEPLSSAASALTSTPSSTVSVATPASLSFGQDVGTQMCHVCDFDMCFPNLDSIDISCGCSLGEDSR